MGRGTARLAGKRGERIELAVFASDGCLELLRGKIVELSTQGRAIVRLDCLSGRARMPLECLAAVRGEELKA
jgi:hypothetical protein